VPVKPGKWICHWQSPLHPSFSQLALVPSISTRHPPLELHEHVNDVPVAPLPFFINATL
jgi:hypothetical protein